MIINHKFYRGQVTSEVIYEKEQTFHFKCDKFMTECLKIFRKIERKKKEKEKDNGGSHNIN